MTASGDGERGDDHVAVGGSSHAEAWNKWFHVFEAGAQALSDRICALAELAPGQRVLDIATGLGEPALTAARRVGPEGRVVAVDVSPDMLAFARERAARLGLDNVDFVEMDAEALSLPARSFDAVLCRWGLMFMRDLDAALARFRELLVPGGRLSAAVWGAPESVPAVALSARVVLDALGLAPPDEGPMSPFALKDVEALGRKVAAAGFAEVRGEWVTVTFTFDSPEAFTAFRRERSGPLDAKIAHLAEDRREAAWRAVTVAAERFVSAEGTVRMDNHAYCLAARRGGD